MGVHPMQYIRVAVVLNTRIDNFYFYSVQLSGYKINETLTELLNCGCAGCRLSTVSSCEPAVSTIGLCSESPTGSHISEEAYRPRFTIDHQHGLFCIYIKHYYFFS